MSLVTFDYFDWTGKGVFYELLSFQGGGCEGKFEFHALVNIEGDIIRGLIQQAGIRGDRSCEKN